MKIRPEQLKTFEQRSERAFEDRLVAHVRQRYASTTIQTSAGAFPLSELADDALHGMIQHCVTRARAYGITWESSAAAFTALMILVGPTFDSHPAIQQELLDPEVPQNSKVDHLRYALPDSVWEEAKAAQEPQAWSAACPSVRFSKLEAKRA